MPRIHPALLIIAVFCSALLGCAGNEGASFLKPDSSSDYVQTIRSGSFKLNIWSDTFVDGVGSGSFELELVEMGDTALASVSVRDAEGLRALFLGLEYDPDQWRPARAVPTGALGDDAEVLRLPVLNAGRGLVEYGQIQTQPQDRPGLNGDALLLSLYFERGRTDDNQQRSGSALADSRLAQTYVLWERQKDFKLRWNFGGPGDYDQNGETNIADLTALAKVFGAHGHFHPFDQNAVVDGDGNGEVNLADITVIGQHYQTSVEGYNIYAIDQTALQTWTAGTALPASGILIGRLSRQDGVINQSGSLSLTFDLATDLGRGVEGFDGSPILDRSDPSGQYSFGVSGTGTIEQAYLVILPFDGENEGSRPAILGGAVSSLTFELEPTVPGDGSRANPFKLSAGSEYQLSLLHPVLGEVAGSFANRIFAVSPEFAAASHAASNHTSSPDPMILPTGSTPEGAVQFSTTLDGLDTNDLVYISDFFPESTPSTPVLSEPLGDPGPSVYLFFDRNQFNQPPIPGITILPVLPKPWQSITINAGKSFDPDDDSLTYEWDLDGDGVYDFPPTPDPILALDPSDLPALPDPTRVPLGLRISDGASQVEEGILILRSPALNAMDISPPTVSIIDPSPGASVVEGSSGLIRVTAQDDYGVARVDVRVGEILLRSEELDPPLTDPGVLEIDVVWTGIGDHAVSAFAVDQGGNTTFVQPFTVSVTTGGSNLPPTAHFSIPQPEVRASYPVLFDMSNSTDPDGNLVTYELDFDGDGVVDVVSLVPTVTFIPSAEGNFPTIVNVIDDGGQTGSFTQQVIVGAVPVWHDTVAAGGGGANVGCFATVAVVDGHPAVAHLDVNNQHLLYSRATDEDGTAWNPPVIVDSNANVGWFPTLVAQPDFSEPCIAYWRQTNQDLYFVRAQDAQGGQWQAPVPVATGAPIVGRGASLCLVSGNPAIAFYNNDRPGVDFVRAQNAAGTAWSAAIPVADGAVDNEARTAMHIGPGGLPLLGYHLDGNVYLHPAGDADGGTWASPLLIHSGAAYGHDFAVHGDYVGVSFFDAGTSNLQFKGGIGVTPGDWHDDAPQDIGTIGGTSGYVGISAGQPSYSGAPILMVYGGSSAGSRVFWKLPTASGNWTPIPGWDPSEPAQYGDTSVGWYGTGAGKAWAARYNSAAGTLNVACCR